MTKAFRAVFFLVAASCVLMVVNSGRAQALLLVPAGLDVGRSHHSRAGAGPRVGVDVSIVNLEPSLIWYGAFAGANYARGAELAFGPELGIAILGLDAGPVWRSSEPGHGWGARTRAHVTWLFTSFYLGYAAFPEAGSNVIEVGLHWKCIPWLVASFMHPEEDLAATVSRTGWSRKARRGRAASLRGRARD